MTSYGAEARLDHVGLSVANLDQMLSWYSHAFELEISNQFEIVPLDLRGAFLTSPQGWRLELLERRGSTGLPPAVSQPEALLRRGYGHICVRISDVESTHARLLELGAVEKMPPSPSPESGVQMSFVADPEGNFIELIDRLEPSA